MVVTSGAGRCTGPSCTGPGGVHVYTADAVLLGRILVPEQAANFTWGDADLKTLFITSASEGLSEKDLENQPDAGKVMAIEVDVPGLPENQARI